MPELKLSEDLEKSVKELAAKYQKLREDIKREMATKTQGSAKYVFLENLLKQSELSYLSDITNRKNLINNESYKKAPGLLQKTIGQKKNDAATLADRLYTLDAEIRGLLAPLESAKENEKKKFEDAEREYRKISRSGSNREAMNQAFSKLSTTNQSYVTASNEHTILQDSIFKIIFHEENTLKETHKENIKALEEIKTQSMNEISKEFDNKIESIRSRISGNSNESDKQKAINELKSIEDHFQKRTSPKDDQDGKYLTLYGLDHNEEYVDRKLVQIRQIQCSLKSPEELCCDYLKSHPALLAVAAITSLDALKSRKIESVNILNSNKDSIGININFSDGQTIQRTLQGAQLANTNFKSLAGLIDKTSSRQRSFEMSDKRNEEEFITSIVPEMKQGYEASPDMEDSLNIDFYNGTVRRIVLNEEKKQVLEEFPIGQLEDDQLKKSANNTLKIC